MQMIGEAPPAPVSRRVLRSMHRADGDPAFDALLPSADAFRGCSSAPITSPELLAVCRGGLKWLVRRASCYASAPTDNGP